MTFLVDRGLAVTLTLLVGGLVAFQPPANADMARHVGDLGATLISLTISWAIIAVLLVASGALGDLDGIAAVEPRHAIGGIAGAAIVFVSIVAVRSLGAGGVAAALVAGQLVVSVVLDRLGVLGLEQVGLTWQRVVGVGLLVAGTLLATSR